MIPLFVFTVSGLEIGWKLAGAHLGNKIPMLTYYLSCFVVAIPS